MAFANLCAEARVIFRVPFSIAEIFCFRMPVFLATATCVRPAAVLIIRSDCAGVCLADILLYQAEFLMSTSASSLFSISTSHSGTTEPSTLKSARSMPCVWCVFIIPSAYQDIDKASPLKYECPGRRGSYLHHR